MPQKLTVCIEAGYYLILHITKDGKDYCILAYKNDFKKFLLNDVKWYETLKRGAAQHDYNGGREITLEEIADDLAHEFMHNRKMQKDYAAWVDLINDDLVTV